MQGPKEPTRRALPRGHARRRLGDLLLDAGCLTREQLAEASAGLDATDGSRILCQRLTQLGYVSDETVTGMLARLVGRAFVRIEPSMIDHGCIDLLPREYMDRHNVLPVAITEGRLVVAVEDFTNLLLVGEITRLSGMSVGVLAATGENIRQARRDAFAARAEGHTGSGPENDDSLKDLVLDIDAEQLRVVEQKQDESDIESEASRSPVVSVVNKIMKSAVRAVASDIHIEPDEGCFKVRFRVDGDLVPFARLPLRMLPAVVSRIKIMAGMDISERRLPQDGAITVTLGDRAIDLRVSTMAARFGEKVVIRIVDRDAGTRDLATLGFTPAMLESFRAVLGQPNGIVLVTGPTGSGKTSTLYGAMSEIVTDGNNVSTIEDPVERILRGVNQFQVHPKVGFTFAGALRAMLRQDPDVIMVGEIRDSETAKLAAEAALTGHLVLSTMHTNDAQTAVPRLVNMGVEPYLVAATLRGVVAQRLVKRNCPSCSTIMPLTEAQTAIIAGLVGGGRAIETAARGDGCRACERRGTRGRIGVFDLLALDEATLVRMICSLGTGGGPPAAPNAAAPFVADGIDKLADGIIPIESFMALVSASMHQDLHAVRPLRYAA